jgi:hypothetical protein
MIKASTPPPMYIATSFPRWPACTHSGNGVKPERADAEQPREESRREFSVAPCAWNEVPRRWARHTGRGYRTTGEGDRRVVGVLWRPLFFPWECDCVIGPAFSGWLGRWPYSSSSRSDLTPREICPPCASTHQGEGPDWAARSAGSGAALGPFVIQGQQKRASV